jgi:hypothetical protein
MINKLRKKTKGTKSTDKETLDQEVTDDQSKTSADGDENFGVIGVETSLQTLSCLFTTDNRTWYK